MQDGILIPGSGKYLFCTVIVLVVDDYADVETGYAHTQERKVLVDYFALDAFVFEHALDYVCLIYVRIFS